MPDLPDRNEDPLPGAALVQALLLRPLGSGYEEFGRLLRRELPFDRLTLYALSAEGGTQGLRVLQALAGEEGVSDVVGRLWPGSAALSALLAPGRRLVRFDDLGTLPSLEGGDDGVLAELRRAAHAGLRSLLLLPLQLSREGPLLGVVLLGSRRAQGFSAREEAALLALGPALAAALRNDAQYLEAERRAVELRAVERLTRASRAALEAQQQVVSAAPQRPPPLDPRPPPVAGGPRVRVLVLGGDRRDERLRELLQVVRSALVAPAGPPR